MLRRLGWARGRFLAEPEPSEQLVQDDAGADRSVVGAEIAVGGARAAIGGPLLGTLLGEAEPALVLDAELFNVDVDASARALAVLTYRLGVLAL